MRHFVIFKGLLSKYFKRTHLMAVKMMGILTVLKSLKKTGQFFFWGGGGCGAGFFFYEEVRSWTSV